MTAPSADDGTGCEAKGEGGQPAVSPHADRIDELAARAKRDRAAFDAPDDPPDGDRALRYLTEGAGPTLLVYVDAHSGGTHDRFAEREYATLEGTMNEYLELYAACHGVAIDASFSLRAAAELLLDTRDVTDVAQLLTQVPER